MAVRCPSAWKSGQGFHAWPSRFLRSKKWRRSQVSNEFWGSRSLVWLYNYISNTWIMSSSTHRTHIFTELDFHCNSVIAINSLAISVWPVRTVKLYNNIMYWRRLCLKLHRPLTVCQRQLIWTASRCCIKIALNWACSYKSTPAELSLENAMLVSA